ncbi:MAG TPA: alpha/beta hydrolase [Candidatus Didemnitutus sp.]|nr:alpha/beta hydrolase [Candidatus Didemnitutus sp.]
MKSRLIPTVALIVPLLATLAWAQQEIPVWPGEAPGSEGKTASEKVRITETEHEHVISSIHHPSLTVFLPEKDTATGAAVVICPGGGHRELWFDHEGINVARWLAAHGVAGFILKYRLAKEEGSTYQVETHSLADLQRAIRLVRSRAGEWGVDPARVGVMGFSAGGELAALGGTRFTGANSAATDPVGKQDDRPAFQALIYPGNSGTIVPAKNSPPAFLVCGYDDRADISAGLARVYLKFKEAGVPAELHIYTGIGHGFGVRESNHTPSATWLDRFDEWLGDRGFLKSAR